MKHIFFSMTKPRTYINFYKEHIWTIPRGQQPILQHNIGYKSIQEASPHGGSDLTI